jgi:hypothetical protein
MCLTITTCRRRKSEHERFELILQDLTDLTEMQRNIIRERVLHVIEIFSKRCHYYSIIFHLGHFIITVGSLIVPALMSVQYADTGSITKSTEFQIYVYWVTWFISLLVTTSNGVITLFKVDKKYYFLHTTLERMRSESWQYLGLTGRYSGHFIPDDTIPTHSNQYIHFIHFFEKIKMKQVEEEYYKQQEDNHSQVAQKQSGTTTTSQPDTLYAPSPEQPIDSMTARAPPSVKDAVNSIILASSHVNIKSLMENDTTVIPVADALPTPMQINNITPK